MEKKNIDWANIGFGYMPTDYRFVANYKDGAWDEGELTTDANITISECAGVLQYAQTCFEGMKAYTTEDGRVVIFRPDLNAKRMEDSAKRLEMPVFPQDRFVKAIEENGGNVVVYENCGGAKSVDRLIDEDAEDIYQAIAERYLAIGCSVMTPDTNRYELLERLLDEYQVEGVVEMTLQACHTYNVEAKSIEKRVKEKGLPYIHIETDYSQADVGQLDTRIAAFLEMI